MKAVIRIWLLLLVAPWVAADVNYIDAKGIALRGEPKYDDDFTHFEYVNPDAPKGGTLRSYATGTFDSLNRYGQRGDRVIGSEALNDTLMVTSDDEISVYYPLIAERVRFADDYSSITFFIHPDATFTDGEAITADDVKFSFEKFMTQGVPQFASYYAFVTDVTVSDNNSVTFQLEGADREQMLSLCSLAVLPEHYWADKDLSEPLKEVPVGSSGTTISDFKFGQYVIYQRVEDYWAEDLPVNRGQNNFDYYRYDYYRDQTVAFEAFKGGEIDLWQENIAKQWATGYDIPAVRNGDVIKETIEHDIPQKMQGFIFNTKAPMFTDVRVRKALSYALDFEWMNKNLFYDQYTRTVSYFQETQYMARDLPSEEELAILEPIRDQIPPEVFTDVYEPPKTDGSGNLRANLRTALALLKDAGWEVKDQKMTHVETGEVFAFELMTFSPVTERVAIPFQENLKRLGIEMSIRQVDTSQFVNRWHNHDFDMISWSYSANAYPSSGLQIVWHSDFIDSTYNQANVTDPAIDYLIMGIVENQKDEDALLHWGRALDRVLLWNHYVIPQWHISQYRIAYVNKFSRPDIRPKYALGTNTWWIDPAKAEALN
ncbi:extracellular solute-binding protein [Reinekea blandensis]|uniref:ABC-type oligopeptide transport system, periplasmic component n=1 Tax=Reinekea blandensis MED297 TaxID=314283 RepID=A4BDT1_9GAMM|nr:extracellular solute-binding protein [Reinekea blandensis]EAR09690.1 ABC-type oligopeptide transport system, periplasmic component [Reinekea blandensis MED297]